MYLGVPSGGNAKRAKFWEPVIGKIEKRLVLWKCTLLSSSGHTQVIKSVLSNLSIYYPSLFRILDGVADKIIAFES